MKITIEKFDDEYQKFTISPPLELNIMIVKDDESDSTYFAAGNDEFNIYACAKTKKELIGEVYSQILFNWAGYVDCSVYSDLSKGAQRLRDVMIDRVTVKNIYDDGSI